MAIGIGVVFLVAALVLLLDAVALPGEFVEVVDIDTLGWILLFAGVLSIVLALVIGRSARTTRSVEERRS